MASKENETRQHLECSGRYKCVCVCCDGNFKWHDLTNINNAGQTQSRSKQGCKWNTLLCPLCESLMAAILGVYGCVRNIQNAAFTCGMSDSRACTERCLLRYFILAGFLKAQHVYTSGSYITHVSVNSKSSKESALYGVRKHKEQGAVCGQKM